ncbi:hypothetical protein NDU88_005563 [Pleurodeles waltl]|uniref:Uncharacterized protein n=1 Tax=Pleurodeles waltl TaxID=8319 RepID=A0AAV7WYM0_PLEWA|nr:hypothetical protein NDU88_005563 [Pleurodeles waltl]
MSRSPGGLPAGGVRCLLRPQSGSPDTGTNSEASLGAGAVRRSDHFPAGSTGESTRAPVGRSHALRVTRLSLPLRTLLASELRTFLVPGYAARVSTLVSTLRTPCLQSHSQSKPRATVLPQVCDLLLKAVSLYV